MNSGTVVMSLCGHDKGRYYVVLDMNDTYAYVVDGKIKRIEKPKKKKIKHLKNTGMAVDLSKYNPLYDAHILKELKSLLKEGGCCLG